MPSKVVTVSQRAHTDLSVRMFLAIEGSIVPRVVALSERRLHIFDILSICVKDR
jgi:hypothetical protein